MKISNKITDKTVVPDKPKINISFNIWELFWAYYKEGLGTSLWDLEISNNALKKQESFLPLPDPKNVNNIILLRKVAFYQLKQCHTPQGLNQELQNLPFVSSSPLTIKHSDRYMLTVAPIIDLFICLEACCHVTSKHVNWNYHLSTVVTSKLTNDIESECRQVFIPAACKIRSFRIGSKNLWIFCQGMSNYLDLLRVECTKYGR